MVALTRSRFAAHHIDVPAGHVTPDIVLRAINAWLLKTFEREWQIVASGIDPERIPHGGTDPFDPNVDDELDPLNWLPSLPSPRFVRGICEVEGCTYLAYLHRFCAACCKRKFKVEVKRTTSRPHPETGQPTASLGLFATSTLRARREIHVPEVAQIHKAVVGEDIINFCTIANEIDKKECTTPLQLGSP
jgi:hypothetical protein